MKKKVLFILLLIVKTIGSLGQTVPLFDVVDVPITSLDGQQLEIYSKIIADDYFEELYFIEMHDLAIAQFGGKIKVIFPNTNNCSSVLYYAKKVDYQGSNYKWLGDIYSDCDSCYCSEGDFCLIKDGSGIYGHLTLDGEDYQIRDLGGEIWVLVKYNYENSNDNNCGMNEEAFGHRDDSKDPPQTNQGNCKVRLLVLYDEDADNQDANIQQTINLAVSELNQILLNSAINPYYLTIEHVGTESFSLATTHTNDPQLDVDAFGTNSIVANLRNTYNADLVVLVTGTDYKDASKDVGGISRMDDVNDALDFALIKEHGFAIVERGAQILGKFTFAHEVGHLFAAGHQGKPPGQPASHSASDLRPGIPHAHSIDLKKGWSWFPFVNPVLRFTVMHVINTNETRIMHYSNPSINFMGQKTGVSGEKNNALMIYNGACTVGSYMPNPDNITGQIQGESWSCADQSECVGAVVWGLASPISYQWSISNDGINWQAQPSSTPNLCVPMPSNDGDRVFIKVMVSSGNTTLILYHEIEVTTTGQNGVACTQRFSNTITNSLIKLYPIPNNIGELNIEVEGVSESMDIHLTDMSGKSVYSQKIECNKLSSKGIFKLDISSLSSGIYFVYIPQYPSYRQKLVIHH